jgi:hypothetical protein
MYDEIAHHRIVDRTLSRILPSRIGGLVVRKDAYDIEALSVVKFVVIETFQFATEHEMQELWLRICGLGHGRLSSPEQWLRKLFQRLPRLTAVNGAKRHLGRTERRVDALSICLRYFLSASEENSVRIMSKAHQNGSKYQQ